LLGGGTSLGDGIPATSAFTQAPFCGAFDSIGNYYFGVNGCRIRMVDTSGNIHTVVGTSCGYGGDLGPATAAKINSSCAITVDRAGTFYLADWLNYRVRKVDKSTGIIHQ
jgi:serine/threonine-protein kinase